MRSGAGHNYVRWQIDDDATLDWDLNGQCECSTPGSQPSYAGHAMSRAETLAYALALRGLLWERRGDVDRAIVDYRISMQTRPGVPGAFNNLAWLIATRDVPRRRQQLVEALHAAEHAVAIERTPNYLDTLACVHAARGGFSDAIRLETEAVRGSAEPGFAERLAGFRARRDCRGGR